MRAQASLAIKLSMVRAAKQGVAFGFHQFSGPYADQSGYPRRESHCLCEAGDPLAVGVLRRAEQHAVPGSAPELTSGGIKANLHHDVVADEHFAAHVTQSTHLTSDRTCAEVMQRKARRQLRVMVCLLPDPGQPLLVARVSWQQRVACSEFEQQLFGQVRQRRTHRGGFDLVPLPPGLLTALRQGAARYRAMLRIVADDGRRAALAAAVATAEKAQQLESERVRELSRWVPAPSSARADGVPPASYPARAEHTQPLESGWLRDFIRTHLSDGAYPQLVLRFGAVVQAAASVRRPPEDVLSGSVSEDTSGNPQGPPKP